MQGTVRAFDPAARAGSVLLDDGAEIPFGAAAFDASPLRLLRSGQRVNIRVAGGAVTAITLAGFPLPEPPPPGTRAPGPPDG
ncbi:hypothetical protein [Sphaerisporangium rufum]|uniref:hypothetical protein n=1 Tax=Sphaerisporangium rufum TaxID=1381558 RepID=UPI001951893B|nr:hypothetical protein [Sphaerisporangium rufum]